MRVAAHQAYYFPWPGYYHKMMSVDKFIIMDDVQFTRREYFNRMGILVNGKKKLLSVPVNAEWKQPMDEVMIANMDWIWKHEKTLRQSYARAKHYGDSAVLFNSYLGIFIKAQRLHHVTIPATIFTARQIGIETEIIQASDIDYELALKTERILNMCLAIGADTYVAGSGGSRNYLDVKLLNENGIKVEWQSFAFEPYEQCSSSGPFVSGLSTIDLLANVGRKNILDYIGRCGSLTEAK